MPVRLLPRQLTERYIMSQQGDAWYGSQPGAARASLACSRYKTQRHQLSWSHLFTCSDGHGVVAQELQGNSGVAS